VTTLAADVQTAVTTGCAAGLAGLEGRYAHLRELAAQGDPLQVAVICLAPDGRVLALQGSRAGAAGEFNRALAARRPIGSLVKPFTAAAAFQLGWSPDSLLDDSPLSVLVGKDVWQPRNSDGQFHGQITLREALVQSRNVPMVRLGLAVSLETVVATLQRAGLTPAHAPASLLGAFGQSPLEVARAFAVLISGGRLPHVHFRDDEPPSYLPALHPTVAASVCGVLEDVARVGTAAALANTVRGPLAAKTGTTDERRDSWFVAVRPRIVTAVWIGTDGNRETGLFGATGAMEIWREIDRRMADVWRQGELPGATMPGSGWR
jgi:penicillin-binding protein 1B